MKGRILVVAGSDSGGGAGIQSDIKTITALDGFAATAVTALTVQNTQGVTGILGIDPKFIQDQMRAVITDIGVDAIKTGMLHNAEVIDAVSDVLENEISDVPIVVDPVMVAKGGAALLDPQAAAALKHRIALIATVLTPNLPEAEALTGMRIRTKDDMDRTAEMLLALGAKAILLKGGHLESETIYNLLITEGGVETFAAQRIDTPHTHGTGCTLASAIATGLAQGLGLRDSVVRAQAYVQEAIRTAPGLGSGHGPINHAHTIRPFDPA